MDAYHQLSLNDCFSRLTRQLLETGDGLFLAELRPPNNANSLITDGCFVVILGDGSNGIRKTFQLRN